jgi:hypothetical protein
MEAGGLAPYNLIQPTISLEMTVPSQGHCGFPPSNLPKEKAKLICQQTDKISQPPESWENRNDPDLVQSLFCFVICP